MSRVVSDSVTVGTVPVNGAIVTGWLASRFGGRIPAEGSLPPVGVPDAAAVITGPQWGSEGAFQITIPNADTYLQATVNGQIGWRLVPSLDSVYAITDLTTYYVATNGLDTNAGTLAQPFATIGKAVATGQASAGPYGIEIGAGTFSYNATPTIDQVVRIRGKGRYRTILQPNGCDGLYLRGTGTKCDYSVLADFTIDGTHNATSGLRIGWATGLTVTGVRTCNVAAAPGHGVYGDGTGSYNQTKFFDHISDHNLGNGIDLNGGSAFAYVCEVYAALCEFNQGYGLCSNATELRVFGGWYVGNYLFGIKYTGSGAVLSYPHVEENPRLPQFNITTWAATTAYAKGARAWPTDTTAHNAVFANLTGAGTSGSSEPNWASAGTINQTVVDGTVTWTNVGSFAARWANSNNGAGIDDTGSNGLIYYSDNPFNQPPLGAGATTFILNQHDVGGYLNVFSAGGSGFSNTASDAIGKGPPVVWQALKSYAAGRHVILPTGGIGYLPNAGTTAATWAADRAQWTFLAGGHYESLSTGSWIIPKGITQLRIHLTGGGGGGGGGGSNVGAATQSGGGGGGAGLDQTFELTGLTPAATATVAIGAGGGGGAGGAAGGNTGIVGTAGGSTTFIIGGVTYTAVGGGRGNSSGANTSGTAGGGTYGGAAQNAVATTNGIPGNGGPSSQASIPLGRVVGGAGGGSSNTTNGGNGGNAATGNSPVALAAGTAAGSGTADGGVGVTATLPGCGGAGGGGGTGGTGAGGAAGGGANGQGEVWY